MKTNIFLGLPIKDHDMYFAEGLFSKPKKDVTGLTMSAATRFKPTPPALVDIIKTNAPLSSDLELEFPWDGGRLKFLMAANRSSARIDSSSLH